MVASVKGVGECELEMQLMDTKLGSKEEATLDSKIKTHKVFHFGKKNNDS